MENLPYSVHHELRSFHPPQKEPLCISALVVWRINTCSLAGSPVPFVEDGNYIIHDVQNMVDFPQ